MKLVFSVLKAVHGFLGVLCLILKIKLGFNIFSTEWVEEDVSLRRTKGTDVMPYLGPKSRLGLPEFPNNPSQLKVTSK